MATTVLDALVQEDAKSSGLSIVETDHCHTKEETQEACSSRVGKKGGGQSQGLTLSIFWGPLHISFPNTQS